MVRSPQPRNAAGFSRRPSAGRGLAAWLVLLGCLLTLRPDTGLAAGGGFNEYAVKGAFVRQFAYFITWPNPAFPRPDSPLVICTLGKEPFGQFQQAIAGKSMRGHPFALRQIRDLKDVNGAGDLGDCQILVVGASAAHKARHLLKTLRGGPVLTIGESDDFLKEGGMINFILQPDQTVAFDINEAAARRAGFSFSARLLRIARSVSRE